MLYILLNLIKLNSVVTAWLVALKYNDPERKNLNSTNKDLDHCFNICPNVLNKISKLSLILSSHLITEILQLR